MRAALALVLAVLAGCLSPRTEFGVLRPPGLRGPWIGLAADGLTYYRLVLAEEGTGLCATAAGKDEKLYRVRTWSLDRGSCLTVHLELVAGGAPEARPLLVLHGTAHPARLELQVLEAHRVTFWREKDLLANRERLRARMRRP